MHLSNTAKNKLYYETIEYIAEQTNKSDYEVIESDSFIHKQNMAKQYMFADGGFGMMYYNAMTVLANIVKFIVIIAIVSTLTSNYLLTFSVCTRTATVSFFMIQLNFFVSFFNWFFK